MSPNRPEQPETRFPTAPVPGLWHDPVLLGALTIIGAILVLYLWPFRDRWIFVFQIWLHPWMRHFSYHVSYPVVPLCGLVALFALLWASKNLHHLFLKRSYQRQVAGAIPPALPAYSPFLDAFLCDRMLESLGRKPGEPEPRNGWERLIRRVRAHGLVRALWWLLVLWWVRLVLALAGALLMACACLLAPVLALVPTRVRAVGARLRAWPVRWLGLEPGREAADPLARARAHWEFQRRHVWQDLPAHERAIRRMCKSVNPLWRRPFEEDLLATFFSPLQLLIPLWRDPASERLREALSAAFASRERRLFGLGSFVDALDLPLDSELRPPDASADPKELDRWRESALSGIATQIQARMGGVLGTFFSFRALWFWREVYAETPAAERASWFRVLEPFAVSSSVLTKRAQTLCEDLVTLGPVAVDADLRALAPGAHDASEAGRRAWVRFRVGHWHHTRRYQPWAPGGKEAVGRKTGTSGSSLPTASRRVPTAPLPSLCAHPGMLWEVIAEPICRIGHYEEAATVARGWEPHLTAHAVAPEDLAVAESRLADAVCGGPLYAERIPRDFGDAVPCAADLLRAGFHAEMGFRQQLEDTVRPFFSYDPLGASAPIRDLFRLAHEGEADEGA